MATRKTARTTKITESSLRAKRDQLCGRMVSGIRRLEKLGEALVSEIKNVRIDADEYRVANLGLAKFRKDQRRG